MNFNIDDDDDDDLDDIYEGELDTAKIIENFPNYKSEKICEMIVCNRYFNFNHDLTVSCMEELGKRRLAGDSFDFESFIEKSFNDLPKLDFVLPDLKSMLSQVISKRK